MMSSKQISLGENMGKNDASPESIKKYHQQGWRFFIRQVNDKKYVTIRRRGKERSLGRYNDELWKMIFEVTDSKKGENVQLQTQVPRKTSSLVTEQKGPFVATIEEVTKQFVKNTFLNCLWVGADDFCEYWHLTTIPPQEKLLTRNESELLFKKVSMDEGEDLWMVKALPVICKACPAYVDMKIVHLIRSKI